jgi:quaternary ammonium compound-resistance protein SugE
MGWVYLLLASAFEIGWAVWLKQAEGFTRLVPSLLTVVSMVLSMVLLAMAMQTIPLGTVYAIWTGIGTIGTVAFGIILFDEPATALRMACIAMIVAGIVGLKLA